MQKLACPNCATEIPSGNMNIEQTIAVCPNCDTVFDFSFISEGKSKEKTKQRRKMHPPKNFRVRDTDSGFEMDWGWFTPMAFFLTFFVIFWDGFLVFWYRMAFGMSGTFGGGPDMIMFLFPLIHVGVGISMTYYTLALYLNRTTVGVNDERIQVKTGPLPYPWKDKLLPCSDIDQIYVKKKISHSKNGTTVTYEVRSLMLGATEEVLASGLSNAEFALFIEQEIEGYLGIENRKVYGEYSGN